MGKFLFLVLFFALLVSVFVFADLQESNGFMDGLEIEPVEDEPVATPTDLCANKICNDGNPCTEGTCVVEGGEAKCVFPNKPDQTPCGESKICIDGKCEEKPVIPEPNPNPVNPVSGVCIPKIESIKFNGEELNPGEQIKVNVDVSNCSASKIVLSVVSVEFDNYDRFWKVFQYPAREETSISAEFDAMEAAGIRLESEKFVEQTVMSSFRAYVVDAVELTAGGYNGPEEISLDFSASNLDPKFKTERNWMKENKTVLLSELKNLSENALNGGLEAGFLEIPAGLDLGFEGTMGFKLQVKASDGKWKISALKSVKFSDKPEGTTPEPVVKPPEPVPPVTKSCEKDEDCKAYSSNDCVIGSCNPESVCEYNNKAVGTKCTTMGNEAGTCKDFGTDRFVCVAGEPVEPGPSGPSDNKPQDTSGSQQPDDVPVVDVPPQTGDHPTGGPVEPEVIPLSGCDPCQTITGCLACLDYQLTGQTEPQ